MGIHYLFSTDTVDLSIYLSLVSTKNTFLSGALAYWFLVCFRSIDSLSHDLFITELFFFTFGGKPCNKATGKKTPEYQGAEAVAFDKVKQVQDLVVRGGLFKGSLGSLVGWFIVLF